MTQRDEYLRDLFWQYCAQDTERCDFWRCFHCGEVGSPRAYFIPPEDLPNVPVDPDARRKLGEAIVIRCPKSSYCWEYWVHEMTWTEYSFALELHATQGPLVISCDGSGDCMPSAREEKELHSREKEKRARRVEARRKRQRDREAAEAAANKRTIHTRNDCAAADMLVEMANSPPVFYDFLVQ